MQSDGSAISATPARPMLVPLIVACGLFMENLDSTVLSTALPSIARSFGENPVHLNLALSSYLFSLESRPMEKLCSECHLEHIQAGRPQLPEDKARKRSRRARRAD